MQKLRRRVPLRDLFGVLWVLAAGVGVLVPALIHGYALGPFDWLSQYGLSAQPGVVVHNHQTFDQMSEMIPWTNLAWTQVHHGQLPLWNPYSALGMPLAFNWQSSVFSVPMLIAYAFPLRLAFTVSLVVVMAIAGTGVYVLGRVLRLGVIGSAMAATIFELSGTYVAWLGWPMAGVMAWAGWLFAFAILIARGRHRVRDITCFALVSAAVVYGGQPEGIVLLGSALIVFTAALLALRTARLGDRGLFVGQPSTSLLPPSQDWRSGRRCCCPEPILCPDLPAPPRAVMGPCHLEAWFSSSPRVMTGCQLPVATSSAPGSISELRYMSA